jgi:MFS family permease
MLRAGEGRGMSVSWSELVRGGNAGRSAVVGGGMIMHALNTFIVTTILPSVVRDIGGLEYFAWSTVLYVVASLLGGAGCAQVLRRMGARSGYRLALGCFALGSVTCAVADTMPVLLLGRFVQGLGAGTLSALSFTMVRTLFPARLWPRALTVVSVAWGLATLLGPAVGGVFAQLGAWRAAFWSVAAAVPLMLALVEFSLPRDLPRPAPGRSGMAFASLFVLAASVLAISVGSMQPQPAWNAAGLVLAVCGLAIFAWREAGQGARVLPRGATRPGAPLAAVYGAMVLMMAGVTPEIFVPYFLQHLHGLSPLHAGYMSALMAGGWTLGSVFSSGAAGGNARIALAGGPAVLAAGLAVLSLLMPAARPPGLDLAAIGLALLAMGLGIGITWPHLGARVFGFAQEADRELAGSSITIVVMVGSAFGSALGGMVTNLGGLIEPGGAQGAGRAAAWLFGVFIAAPLVAALAIRRLPLTVRPAAAE